MIVKLKIDYLGKLSGEDIGVSEKRAEILIREDIVEKPEGWNLKKVEEKPKKTHGKIVKDKSKKKPEKKSKSTKK